MTLTVQNIPVLVRSLLASRGADVSNLRNNRILALVDIALRRLAEVTASTSLLRKSFTVTAINGEASLATPLSATEPLLLDGLRRAQIFIDGFNHAAQYKADRSSLTFSASNQFAYWTLENQTLIIRDGTGLDNYDGPAVIRSAPYVPLLANVPATLGPIFIELLAELLTNGKPVPATKVVAAN